MRYEVQEIMEEIGLTGSHKKYKNHPDVRTIRYLSVQQLAEVIEEHSQNGEEICPPLTHLITVLSEIEQYECAVDGDNLEITWRSIAEVVDLHLRYFEYNEQEREEYSLSQANNMRMRYGLKTFY
jgi:hypothetical protein